MPLNSNDTSTTGPSGHPVTVVDDTNGEASSVSVAGCTSGSNVQNVTYTQPLHKTCSQKCQKPRCKCCAMVEEKNCFSSSANSKSFSIRGEGPLSCISDNLIYLVTCSRCKIQYVGQTKNLLRERMSGHRSKLSERDPKLYLYKHFHAKNGHVMTDFKVTVIEKIPKDPDTTKNEQLLLAREKFWIYKLQTLYPFGLNDSIKGFGNISFKGTQNVPYFVPEFATKRKKRSHGKRRHKHTKVSVPNFENLVQLYKGDNGRYLLRCHIFSLPLHVVKELLNAINNINGLQEKSRECQVIVTAICNHRLGLNSQKSYQDLAPKKRKILKLHFHNKGLQYLNLSSILHDKSVKRLVPACLKDQEPPIIAYTLNPSVGQKIFNYGKFLKNLTMEQAKATLENNCRCENHHFVTLLCSM